MNEASSLKLYSAGDNGSIVPDDCDAHASSLPVDIFQRQVSTRRITFAFPSISAEDSYLSFRQLDPSLAKSFAFTHVYQSSQPAPDYRKLPIHIILLNGSSVFSARTNTVIGI